MSPETLHGLQVVLVAVERTTGVRREMLLKPFTALRYKPARQLAICLARRCVRPTLAELASFFGCSQLAADYACTRAEQQLVRDPAFASLAICAAQLLEPFRPAVQPTTEGDSRHA